MKAAITGLGWLNRRGRGQGRQTAYVTASGKGRLDLSARGILDKPGSRLGRMDEYSRLGLLAIALALKDARLDQWTTMRNISVISSTVYGCLQTDSDYYDTVVSGRGHLASPNLFAYTLSNTFLGEAAIHFGLTGAGFIVHEDRLSGVSGLLLALNSLAGKECEAVITGICDILPPPSVGLKEEADSGALFFVLQPASTAPEFSYGHLNQGNNGKIFFQGKPVEDLHELAGWCASNSKL